MQPGFTYVFSIVISISVILDNICRDLWRGVGRERRGL